MISKDEYCKLYGNYHPPNFLNGRPGLSYLKWTDISVVDSQQEAWSKRYCQELSSWNFSPKGLELNKLKINHSEKPGLGSLYRARLGFSANAEKCLPSTGRRVALEACTRRRLPSGNLVFSRVELPQELEATTHALFFDTSCLAKYNNSTVVNKIKQFPAFMELTLWIK